ncbi:MAG: class I SAM-dependent methyltransferase [Planctomycetota bacterium]|nr:MAG: class I SAM-dependent methyltransferase [Planctomycetota bacterium]REK42158.1 MAG: class I SAM-dependent methyltransferase [Planctomycetota bacterium]
MSSDTRQSSGRRATRGNSPGSASKPKHLAEPSARKPRPKKVVNELLENDLIRRVSYDQYRGKVQEVYAGPKGAILSKCSQLSGHVALGERMFRRRQFDLRGCREILDVGSGAGQILGHLLKYADAEAHITGIDISTPMLQRARRRLKSNRPDLVAADLANLPFADASFDCVTCGYVLEHMPEASTGLSELARVMRPGGRMLLFTTEDSFGGAWTSRIWCCRTYNRRELLETCRAQNLHVLQELWFTPIHKLLRAGGICVELEKRTATVDAPLDAPD